MGEHIIQNIIPKKETGLVELRTVALSVGKTGVISKRSDQSILVRYELR